MTDLTIVFMAAGKGTRLLPLTETTHKLLLDIEGKPLLLRAEKSLSKLIDAYKTNSVFLLNYKSEQFATLYPDTLISDVPLHDQSAALLMAREHVGKRLLVYYPDTIIKTDFKCLDPLPEYDVAFYTSSKYPPGRILLNAKDATINRIVELSSGYFHVVGGYYFYDTTKLFNFLEKQIATRDIGWGYKFTEDVSNYIQAGNEMQLCKVDHHITVNTHEDLAKAREYYKEKK